MSPREERTATRTDTDDKRPVHRRRFLTLAGSAGAVALAGCSGDGGSTDGDGGNGNGDDGTDDSDPTATSSDDVGTFRLLISDQPVAIDEFDSLNVSLDRARVFRDGGDNEEDDEETATAAPTETDAETTDGNETTATPSGNETTTTDETVSPTPTPTSTDSAANDGEGGGDEDETDGGDGENGGFSVIDLEGATVDLTQVLGEKALGVFEGGLPAGRYTKIELYAADVEGVVDGDSVEVKIPSGKLQIVKPFEIAAGETLSFVFDITVVKKGKTGEYNLQPVISESGVAGKDVEVQEVGDGRGGDAGSSDGDDEPTEQSEGGTATDEPGGPPENGSATPTDD